MKPYINRTEMGRPLGPKDFIMVITTELDNVVSDFRDNIITDEDARRRVEFLSVDIPYALSIRLRYLKEIQDLIDKEYGTYI